MGIFATVLVKVHIIVSDFSLSSAFYYFTLFTSHLEHPFCLSEPTILATILGNHGFPSNSTQLAKVVLEENVSITIAGYAVTCWVFLKLTLSVPMH